MNTRLPFVALTLALALSACSRPKTPEAPKPVLAVSVVAPREAVVAERIPAYGGVFAWQESSLGTEVGGLRITELLVEVGDKVRKGQVLARLNADTLRVDVEASAASLADAEAVLAQAKSTADRARQLGPSGAMSQQDYSAALAAEKSAGAKRAMLSAQLAAQKLKLKYTNLVASDDGVISARAGSVGQVVPLGTELFKMIRQGRLEWRAEVKAENLMRFEEKGAVELSSGEGPAVAATIRKIAPAVDTTSRTGLVYVDLPADARVKPGMYVHGAFLGKPAPALTVPMEAVVRRDGHAYVLAVSDKSTIQQKEVGLGARVGDSVAVTGLAPTDRLVASGGAFLSQGDLVTVEAQAAK